MMSTGFTTKYKVMYKIGEGSFSEVLRCQDRLTGVNYAAKKLKKVFRTRDDILNCAEIVAMKKMQAHPNILQMLEYYYDSLPGKVVFIFELMDTSIYDYMKKRDRCLPEIKVKSYLYQMLKGLDHLHRSGLFHRDIKPENILLKALNGTNLKGDVVKLADLGSIRGIYSNLPYTEYISTRWYRSPECLLTMGYYGPKMDVWATGCVFYEMITSKPLFPGKNEIDQLSRIHTVLGTPSSKFLNKLKSKSRNCKCFPKQTGLGVHSVTPNITEDGLNVLKAMIQYDPDNRINVKRLLEHKYFWDLRHEELAEKYENRKLVGTYEKISGDYKMSPSNYYTWKTKIHKIDLVHSNSTDNKKKTQNTSGGRKMNSKTTSDVLNRGSSLQPKPHFIRQGTEPLVGYKQIKAWGVNPSILSNEKSDKKIARPNVTQFYRDSHNKNKCLPQKKVPKNNTNTFRKTTSNLPQIKMMNTEEILKTKRFQSKSFVLPWRMAGKAKLETIEELSSKLRRDISKLPRNYPLNR